MKFLSLDRKNGASDFQSISRNAMPPSAMIGALVWYARVWIFLRFGCRSTYDVAVFHVYGGIEECAEQASVCVLGDDATPTAQDRHLHLSFRCMLYGCSSHMLAAQRRVSIR